MTDPTGRHARWTSAVVLAPGAAALFGAAVSWAQTTPPATYTPPTRPAPVPPAVTHGGPSTQALQWRRVAEQRHQERRALAAELGALRRHVAALRTAARRAARHAAPVAVPVPAGNYQVPAPGPVTQYVPPPAPVVVQAPPVQGSTGSSGKP
jgi:hypothetical protein